MSERALRPPAANTFGPVWTKISRGEYCIGTCRDFAPGTEGTSMGDVASAIGIRADELSFVQELQSGSEEAFALLIAQYSGSVYSLIARSLRDPADAADVTQDVFVKVFRNISSFHGDSCLRTWIYRIALREASNQRRWWSRHKKQELAIDEPHEGEDGETYCIADALAAVDASPYDNAARAQLHLRVEAALATLPGCFRDVVVLREIEGFGYEEIAEILKVTVGTVKSRLARGRVALRKALEDPLVGTASENTSIVDAEAA